MASNRIDGANCYNCDYISTISESTGTRKLNDQGGIDPITTENIKKARQANLITFPGGSKTEVSDERLCNNPKIEMFVTARMHCSYWNNKTVRKPWENKAWQPEYLGQLI